MWTTNRHMWMRSYGTLIKDGLHFNSASLTLGVGVHDTDKTELIWFGSRQILEKVSGSDLMLHLDSSILKPVDVVRDLGVLLDTELSMKQHITRIASNCFYHLRRLRQIRRIVGKDVTSQLISSFVLSRLDYCNSLLAGLPRTSVEPLQRVQNAAARLAGA